jgi:hypothetical protein
MAVDVAASRSPCRPGVSSLERVVTSDFALLRAG